MSLTWLAISNEWELVCDGCRLAGGVLPAEQVPLAPLGWAVIAYSDGAETEHYCDECVELARREHFSG